MEEAFETVPSPEELEYCESEIIPMELFPESSGISYDQLSDESGSSLIEQSCASPSSPASPHTTDIVTDPQQVQLEFPSSGMITSTFPSPEAIQPQDAIIKNEVPSTALTVYTPPVKREHIDSSSTAVVPALFPDMLNSSNPSSCLSVLAKGRSEDIELYRNMLRCHGSLTPEMEEKLRHLSRQVKNRESAQISRKRKREYVELLRNTIVKMRTVDSSLRSVLNAAQSEASKRKSEADRWQAYAHDLQSLLRQHGIDVPCEPPAISPCNTLVPLSVSQPIDDVLPDSVFEGPCGFGHMTPPKTRRASKAAAGKKRGRSEKKQRQ